jgi:hypothetical protein
MAGKDLVVALPKVNLAGLVVGTFYEASASVKQCPACLEMPDPEGHCRCSR